MIDTNLLKSIFDNHSIDKVILVDNNECLNFIINSMEENLELSRWENLENILKHVTKKEILLLSYPQAKQYLGQEYLNKGVII